MDCTHLQDFKSSFSLILPENLLGHFLAPSGILLNLLLQEHATNATSSWGPEIVDGLGGDRYQL